MSPAESTGTGTAVGADQDDRLGGQTTPAPARRWLPRRWGRIVVGLVLAGIAIHLLLPHVGELRTSLDAARHAHPAWLAAALVAAFASFPASALSLLGSTARRLPMRRTTWVELAAAFVNRLTPAGLGRAGLLARYLSLVGIDGVQVAGSIGVNLAAGAVVHVLALVVAAVFVRPSMIRHVAPLPDRWIDLLSVLGVLVGAGLLVAAVVVRRRWPLLRDRAITLREHLREVVARPRWLAALLLGSLLVNLTMIVSLQLSLVAFGARPAFAVVALVYLGGSALASVAPTPGGLGAMEAALVAGLTALSVSTGPAVTGVLAFRLISWWLPALVGMVSLGWLSRRALL